MKKILLTIVLVPLGLFLFLFWLMYFSARPPLMTDPATLAGDGSSINYCELPALDSSGKNAVDIAKGNTPGCGYDHFPLPILAECTEPLPEGAADIRGLWRGVSGKIGHVERLEQCGSRVVITTAGIIHDGGPNSSVDIVGLNSNDTEGSVLFTVGGKEYCGRTSASMIWNNDVLDFHALGWGPVVVRRYLEGEQLIWEYLDGSTTRMDRICTLPEENKVPRPRGRRYSIF
ncbi:MAG: hypothetical protein ACI8QT_002120 [Halioglobus sp.]|jgi:hypothetical protein